MIDCTRMIRINCGMETVDTFIGNVENLPSWTGFFHSVGPADAFGRHEAKTLLGTIDVWIEERHEGDTTIHEICSVISGTEERAMIMLQPVDGAVVAEFTVRLLTVSSRDEVEAQCSRQEQELESLRLLLERSNE
jgi:hypothetical protein